MDSEKIDYYKSLLIQYSTFTKEDVKYNLSENQKDEYNHYLLNFLEHYKLYNIAGNGDDLTRVFRIIRWVNKFVPINKPLVSDFWSHTGYTLLQKALDGYSLNCAGYAILTNDLFNSFGFKSKCIWCMPYDYNDNECHVVNHVYINSLNKWIIADAAFGNIPTGNNKLLDIIELREYLKNDIHIKLMKNLKYYYNEEQNTKYINYMYKNIFRFIFCNEYKFNNMYCLVPLNYEFNNNDLITTTNLNYLYYR